MICRPFIASLSLAATLLASCGDGAPTTPNAPLEAPEPASPERLVHVFDEAPAEPFWRGANIYFLITDRFSNGDPSNDDAYGRQPDGAPFRSFMGGDLRGVIDKLDDGYFAELGVNVIWTTPLIEQVRGSFVEDGATYAYHGYWPRDWTRIDRAFGTEADFAEFVKTAHGRNTKVVMDVILNHAGPNTAIDPVWPADWVRSEPSCDFESYALNITCVIVPALQDIRTESDTPVDLPEFLVEKWRDEGRLDEELAELDAFFERTGHPRAPKYYLIK